MGMNRDRAYYRKMRRKHIARKVNIVKNTWYASEESLHDAKFVGRLNKGKVHCSCMLCTGKTKYRGYSARDLRNIDKVNYIDDYNLSFVV